MQAFEPTNELHTCAKVQGHHEVVNPKGEQGEGVPVLSHLRPTQQLLEQVPDSRLDQLPACQPIGNCLGNEAGVVDAGGPFPRFRSYPEAVVEVAHVLQVQLSVLLEGHLRNCLFVGHQPGDGGSLGP